MLLNPNSPLIEALNKNGGKSKYVNFHVLQTDKHRDDFMLIFSLQLSLISLWVFIRVALLQSDILCESIHTQLAAWNRFFQARCSVKKKGILHPQKVRVVSVAQRISLSAKPQQLRAPL